MSRYTASRGRRIFLSTIGCAFLAAAVRAETKPPQSIPRLGVLLIGSQKDSAQARELIAFTKALSLLGWTERENYWMDARWAQEPETLPRLASDLVQQGVNVILAPGPQATRAARAATSIIPIVTIAGTDPRQVGAASLARPGGNITGLTIGEVEAVNAKRLQLITEAIPGVGQVAVVWDVKRGVDAPAEALTSLDVAARSLTVQLKHLDIASVDDFENTFKAARKGKSRAVLMVESPRAVVYRKLIADLALKHGLPVMSQFSRFVEAGGWMSYGPDLTDLFSRAAIYVSKILKGANPADLPVEQPTKFELVINLKTAKALGLTIPQSLLLRADQVIE